MEDRGWADLLPGDVAKSIMIEGAELLEHFQWENLSLEDIKKKAKIKEIKKELADVLIYALELSVLLDFDTEKIIRDKLAESAKKYPAKTMKRLATNQEALMREYWKIKQKHRKKK